MEGVGEGGVQGVALDVSAPEGVVRAVGPPVQRGRDDVVAAARVGVVVAARLHDVDLAAGGPHAVVRLGGEEPDRRPDPVAFGEFGGDFDTAIFDGAAFLGVDAARFDGRDDRAVRGIGRGDAVGPEGRGADALLAEVDDVVVVDEVGVLEGRLDVQHVVFDEHVFVGDGCLLELAVAKPTDFGFLRPDRGVECTAGEVFEEDGAVVVVYNRAEAIPDEKAGKCEADEETSQRNDGNPFLARVFMVEPRLFNRPFLHTTRVEVRPCHALQGSRRGCSGGCLRCIWGCERVLRLSWSNGIEFVRLFGTAAARRVWNTRRRPDRSGEVVTWILIHNERR